MFHVQTTICQILDQKSPSLFVVFWIFGRVGVGLLVGSVDETGTHLFETCPSGNYYEYLAMAIGARSQSAKTYLEKNYETFAGLGW